MPTVESILEDALKLSQDERELLAEHILCSIQPDPGWEEAWTAELDRRVARIESGVDKPIPWREVERRVFGPR
jgi:putative addiction module component (TIGR02574 family)